MLSHKNTQSKENTYVIDIEANGELLVRVQVVYMIRALVLGDTTDHGPHGQVIDIELVPVVILNGVHKLFHKVLCQLNGANGLWIRYIFYICKNNHKIKFDCVSLAFSVFAKLSTKGFFTAFSPQSIKQLTSTLT